MLTDIDAGSVTSRHWDMAPLGNCIQFTGQTQVICDIYMLQGRE